MSTGRTLPFLVFRWTEAVRFNVRQALSWCGSAECLLIRFFCHGDPNTRTSGSRRANTSMGRKTLTCSIVSTHTCCLLLFFSFVSMASNRRSLISYVDGNPYYGFRYDASPNECIDNGRHIILPARLLDEHSANHARQVESLEEEIEMHKDRIERFVRQREEHRLVDEKSASTVEFELAQQVNNLSNETILLRETLKDREEQTLKDREEQLAALNTIKAELAQEQRRNRDLTEIVDKHIQSNRNALAAKRIVTAECVMCLSEAASHVLVPCGHLLFCHLCGPLSKAAVCPVCRKPVTAVVKVWA